MAKIHLKKPFIGIMENGFVYLVEIPKETAEEPKSMEDQFLETFNEIQQESEYVRERSIVERLVQKYSWKEDKALKYVWKRLRSSYTTPYFLEAKAGRWQKG